MSDVLPGGSAFALAIAGEQGPLHGQLDLLPGANGLVVLAHAAEALDQRESVVAAVFRRAGVSTLCVDLLARQEERFADARHNVPLLARRLLDFLALLKNRMLLGEIARQPLGLFGANATSPVVVRVAALRDHDIAAIACRDGLIDLAGMLYLRSLESPLLLFVDDRDAARIVSSRRALQEIHGTHELRLIPEIGVDVASSPGFQIAAETAAQWFVEHFKAASPGAR